MAIVGSTDNANKEILRGWVLIPNNFYFSSFLLPIFSTIL